MADDDPRKPAQPPAPPPRPERGGLRRRMGAEDAPASSADASGGPTEEAVPAEPTRPGEAGSAEPPLAVEGGSGGGPPATGVPVPGPPPRPERRKRFVISQRLAGHPDARTRSDMVDLFAMRIDRVLLPDADLVSDLAGAAVPRRVVVIEADPEEIAARRRDLTADTLVEPERVRVPAAVGALKRFALAPDAEETIAGPGTGGMLSLSLVGPDGEPVAGAIVVASFVGRRGPASAIQAGSISDGEGRVGIPFDPDAWLPVAASATPRSAYWGASLRFPQSGQRVALARLPRRGPFGWWHLLSGAPDYDPAAGEGITVGVVDTGVGPHPCLDHVVPVGAFLGGRFSAGPEMGRDASDHGTHVAGLIGARPGPEGGDYGGLAPGAEIRMARVFAPDRLANQGDVALAVAALASTHNADLVNLSLGGEASEIERDAIILARREGALCIAAAGNTGGPSLAYPAAYPECAAVSALALYGSFPPNSDAAASLPAAAGSFGAGGLYVAAYSGFGPELAAAAAGSAVISTVPAGAEAAPYAEMSGTSMAAPLATAALATLLSRDPVYRDLPRSAARSDRAAELLASRALPIGLGRALVGAGLARAR